MSVLRAPADQNINRNFGGLGQAISNIFDPRLRWEAYELQQRILMQRLQMQELQRKFGARDDLKQAYLNDPAFRSLMDRDPEVQAIVNYGIESGASMADIEKEIGTRKLVTSPDTTDPNAVKSNIGAAIQLEGKQYTGSPTGPVVGPDTAGAAAKADIARKQAEAEAQARGTLIGGGAKLAPGEELKLPGGFSSGVATFDPITGQVGFNVTGGGPSSGAANTPSQSQTPPVSPAAQTAPASAGSGAQMNSGQAGSSTVGAATVTANPAGVGQNGVVTISGANPAQVEAQKNQVSFVGKDAQDIYNKQRDVARAEGIIRDIRALENITKTGGVQGQLSAAWRQHLHDEYGLALDPQATAQTAIGSLIVDTLANNRTQNGLTTVRVGEINPIIKPILGSPTMPPGALDTILAQEQSGIDIDKKNIANATSYLSGGYGALGNGEAEAAYLRGKKANEDTYATTRQKNNDEFNNIVAQAQKANQPGGINAPNAAAAPPDPLAVFGNMWSGISHLFGGGGGGTPPATATPPGPAPAPAPPQSQQPPGPILTPQPDGTWR